MIFSILIYQDSDAKSGDESEQRLREKALRTMKKKNQAKHDDTPNSNSSE